MLPPDGTPASAAATASTAGLASRAPTSSCRTCRRWTRSGRLLRRATSTSHHTVAAVGKREFLNRVRYFGHPTIIERIRLVVGGGEPHAAILDFARHNATDLIALAWHGGLGPRTRPDDPAGNLRSELPSDRGPRASMSLADEIHVGQIEA
jgi:hypothetical protein